MAIRKRIRQRVAKAKKRAQATTAAVRKKAVAARARGQVRKVLTKPISPKRKAELKRKAEAITKNNLAFLKRLAARARHMGTKTRSGPWMRETRSEILPKRVVLKDENNDPVAIVSWSMGVGADAAIVYGRQTSAFRAQNLEGVPLATPYAAWGSTFGLLAGASAGGQIGLWHLDRNSLAGPYEGAECALGWMADASLGYYFSPEDGTLQGLVVTIGVGYEVQILNVASGITWKLI